MVFDSRKSRLPLRIVAAAVLQMLAVSAFAADEAKRIEELEKKLAASLEQIEKLTNRVNQLEAAKAAPAPVATAPAPSEPAPMPMDRMASMDHPARDAGVPLHGFADVGYSHRTNPVLVQKNGFYVGNLDLYITPELGDRVRTIFELVFEYGPDSPEIGTDLERIQFGYTFSDAATLWMGRFHTPYGYWNTAFHHGAQMQTAATRPRFVDFEDKGGILPAHGVGLMLSGGTRAGDGRAQYDAYFANGDRIIERTLDLNNFGDDNGNKMVGGNVRYTFGGGALAGLTLGLHALTEKVDAYQTDTVLLSSSQVNVAGGFVVYDQNDWEVIGEYYHFRNKDLLGTTGLHSSNAAFLQAGRLLAGKWTPYLRAERASLDQTDPYFANQDAGRSYNRQVAGIRYDLNPSTALKLEIDRLTQWQSDGTILHSNGARVQYAVRF
jgi:hypothetical protein